MLNRLDDYLIHQTPEPLAHPTSGDRNIYDRHWMNGYTRDGSLFFAAALGLYPNRRVMDASVSVVRDGVQYSLHASRLAPGERTETRVGPIAVDVVEPMRRLRLSIGPNDNEIAGELLFEARTLPIEEPRVTRRFEGHVLMDATRFTQFGTWTGELSVAGKPVALEAGDVLATRDRSWGVRPAGEPEGGAPGAFPQFFWLWAPVHFDDVCTHFQVNEDAEGRPSHTNGVSIQALTAASTASQTAALPTGCEVMSSVAHELLWQPGTRRARAARLRLTALSGHEHVVDLEPILVFQMRGLGYLDPEWGHGLWKGDLAVGGESWRTGELDPMDFRHLHVQQLCRAKMGEREGVGVLEQLVIGPHAPSGFSELLDAAT
jgi:hypothetical protein